MALRISVKVVEHCHVSPSPSAPPMSLPLTFFDVPWLLFPPSQPLFFYDFPHSLIFFTNNVFPILKRSLSFTLTHFFPFSGSISASPSHPSKPHLLYSVNDSVSVVLAESDGDFAHLSAHHPRDSRDFDLLVPHLRDDHPPHHHLPLLAVQITVFPEQGFCVGLAYRHVVADGRTFDNFVKSWASVCRSGSDSAEIGKLSPCFDRNLIGDPSGLKETFLKEWTELKTFKSPETGEKRSSETVRATFLVTKRDMERIKNSILKKLKKKNHPESSLLLSPYVIACAFLWVCLIKSRRSVAADEELENQDKADPLYFGFIAGGLHRLNYQIPTNYFGNCVAFGRAKVTKCDLLGEDGLFIAAKAIGDKIKELNDDVLGRADKWISDWEGMMGGSEVHVKVSGSPKVDMYGLDFGWGRPRKIEEVSVEGSGWVSLIGSREMEGEIEVGLCLPIRHMNVFTCAFTQPLSL